jgi:hypothetical protein
MRLEKMSRMMGKMKLLAGVVGVLFLGIIISCGPEYAEPFDSEEQLAIDIELIEAYLAEKGYTEYDTLDGDIRMVILDEGSGDPIEYNDIVSFHFIGRFLNDTIFDTTIKALALEQDVANAIDTTFQLDDNGNVEIDDEGNPVIDEVEYVQGYVPVYSSSNSYSTLKVTHTPGDWYAEQIYSSGYINGFSPSIVFMLNNLKIQGRLIAYFPSEQAYGDTRSNLLARFRNRVLAFEFRPVTKR